MAKKKAVVKEKVMVECPECDGSGAQDCYACGSPNAEECETCMGTGEVEEEEEN